MIEQYAEKYSNIFDRYSNIAAKGIPGRSWSWTEVESNLSLYFISTIIPEHIRTSFEGAKSWGMSYKFWRLFAAVGVCHCCLRIAS